MALFTTLYSGSSGNCALILHGGKYLLVDMGKSCRTTLNALRRLNLAVSDCQGVLITHEHSDHVSGLDTFLKHYTVPVFGCADTLDMLCSRGTIPPAVEAVAMDGRTEEIGGFSVSSFPTRPRIASDCGHLDNKACAAELLDLIQDGCKKFALCHLSQTNNSPELALTTVYSVLLAAGIEPGKDVLIQAQTRNDISPYIEF